jgi:pimeloyl-ACP methyl ester carboxylesterase
MKLGAAGFFVAVLGVPSWLLAVGGCSDGAGGGVTGGGAGGAVAEGAASSQGAGEVGGAGESGGEGEGATCEAGGLAPAVDAYSADVAGQALWVHDEGFPAGYFHTYDALTLPGADERPRKVNILLPRDYPTSCERYPVVYFNDGETTFWPGGPGNKSWSVAQGLESLYLEDAVPQVIVVAVHALDRNYEYSHMPYAPDGPCCGVETYSDYLADSLKVFLDSHYRTRSESESSAIVGSSRGGLAAFVVANLRPDAFRMAGCLSPSFWLGLEPVWGGDFAGGPLATSALLDLTKDTLSDPASRPTLWIDWGLVFSGGFHNEVIEQNAALYGQEMVQLLQADYGYSTDQDLFWMEDAEGEHDELSWARRFPLVMKAFFGAR